MNLRDLRHLIAVADHRNFTRAADIAAISQPALSSKIKKLETTLEQKIFERGRTEVTLTAFGEELVEIAREMIALADRIHDRASAMKSVDAAPVRLGLTPTLAAYLSGYFRQMLATLYPGLPLVIVEEKPAALARMVETKAVDVAFLARKSHTALYAESVAPMAFTPLWLEPAYLAVPTGHSLSESQGIHARDVPPDMLIRFDTPFGYDLEADLPTSDADNAARVGIDVRTARFETVCRHVAQNDACTLVNGVAAMQFMADGFGLAFVPFRDAGNLRELGAISRPGCPRYEVVEAMRAYIADNPPAGTQVPAARLTPRPLPEPLRV
ncbi:LysR family transcriptional regulator [Jannaschia marina]|uniref:LysR family transcriptional regulator n=1 Tax=Jannaschia marina TaxID=2741674 RepID=UPI0015CEEDA9|nr:LysR family transcriptional regulator [Jannaschia marina]